MVVVGGLMIQINFEVVRSNFARGKASHYQSWRVRIVYDSNSPSLVNEVSHRISIKLTRQRVIIVPGRTERIAPNKDED